MPDHDVLEQRLRRAARHIALPDTPDLADRVMIAIERSPAAQPLRRPFWARPAFAGAFAVLLVAVSALVFSPVAREAVADWIGLDGLRIRYGEQPQAGLGDDLHLGKKTTLAEATAQAGFEVEAPAELGAPDEVYLARSPGTRISLVYAANEELPRTRTTRVGALLSVFPAELDRAVFEKGLATGTSVERIEVSGAEGYWLSGEEHALYYIDESGELTEDRARLAGNTLAWQEGNVVYRLETALSKSEALEIARSVP